MARFLKNPLRNLGNLPEEVRRPLPSGVGGNYFTVKIIKDLAHKRKGHPKVRKLAENIISLYGTKSQNFYDECMAIGKWVHKNVPYLKDPHGVESVKDPLTMIDQLCRDEFYGDCDDMVILICTLLLSIGHKPKVAIVRYPNFSDGYQHIYVVCYERNYREGHTRRIVIDAIVKDKPIGYEVPSIAKKEIDI